MTEATSTMPRIVIRWAMPRLALRYLKANEMKPSWRHFLPHLGKSRNGLCFDLQTSGYWRSSQPIGFAIHTDDLPDPAKAHAIDGNAVHSLTDRLIWSRGSESDALKKEAAENLPHYLGRPDELFYAGTIDDLGSRLRAIFLVEGEAIPQECEAAIRQFAQEHGLPVVQLQAQEINDVRRDSGGIEALIDRKKKKPSRAP